MKVSTLCTLVFVVVFFKLLTFPSIVERICVGTKRDLLQLQRALIRVQTLKTPKKPIWTRKYQIPLKIGQGWYGWPPRCIKLENLESTSIQLRVHMPQEEVGLVCDIYEEEQGFLEKKFVSRSQENGTLDSSSRSGSSREPSVQFLLQPQRNYKVTVQGISTSHMCSLVFSTPGDENNWINDHTFQVFGTPLLRHWLGLSSTRTLRYWIPLYSGGYSVECSSSIQRCSLILGRDWDTLSGEKSAFFGVLQPIWIPNNSIANLQPLHIEMNIQSLSDQFSPSCIVVIYGTSSQIRQHSFVWKHICQEYFGKLTFRVNINKMDRFLYLALVKNASSSDAIKITDISVRPDIAPSTSNVEENTSKESLSMNLDAERIFVVARWRKPQSTELTIAIPLSMHRIFTLKELLKFYATGPVVAVIAIRSEQEKNELLEHLSRIPSYMRMNVEFVVVLISPWKSDRFPINRLRNIALNYTTTDFVCVLDVDTFPISSSFTIFRQIIEKEPELLPLNRKRCLVVANWIAADSEHSVRPSIHDLRAKYLKTWFPYCKASQSPVSFRRWLYDNHSFFVSFQPNFEPYCIMRTRDFISFDERFQGYGFNKVSWAVEATVQEVEFLVDNRFFVLHKDHPTQNAENSFQYWLNWITYYTFVNEKLFETIE